MRTLLLNRDNWDICLDAGGNLAIASDPYSQAQDAASEIKVFQGEYFYDTQVGLPYFTQILGHKPSQALIIGLFTTAALSVPGVVEAQVVLSGIVNRLLSGTVFITNSDGQTSNAGF